MHEGNEKADETEFEQLMKGELTVAIRMAKESADPKPTDEAAGAQSEA